MYFFTNIRSRIKTIKDGDIKVLRWPDDTLQNLNNQLEPLAFWEPLELKKQSLELLDKINEMVGEEHIIKNWVIDDGMGFEPYEKASQYNVDLTTLRLREELVGYRFVLTQVLDEVNDRLERIKSDHEEPSTELTRYRDIIEKHLKPFSDNIETDELNFFKMTLAKCFVNNVFINLDKPIQTTGKVSKDALGSALKRIYKDCKNKKLPYEYFRFAQKSISAFLEVELHEDNLTKSPLYKHFTKEQ